MPAWPTPDRKPRKYDPRIDPFRYEKELQEWVRNACRRLGLLYFHTHNSKHSPFGFPDCIIIDKRQPHRPRLLALELKTPWNPNPTGKQKEWLDAFALLGFILNTSAGYTAVQAYLCTHEDLTEIAQVLATS